MAKLWTVLLIGLFSTWDTINGYYNERRTQCFYSKRDLSDMVYVDSLFFNKIEYVQFNSSVGKFVGYTAYGIFKAEQFNNDTRRLHSEQISIDYFCRHNAVLFFAYIIDEAVEPKIKLKSVKLTSGSHHAMLMCSAYDFYPKTIKVSWMKDGKPVISDVTSTEEMPDGDWYYQVHSELMYTPKSGEKISCVVEHASFKKPMIIDWDPSIPDSGRNKIAMGASGLVLGIILSAAGFIYYKKKSSRPY